VLQAEYDITKIFCLVESRLDSKLAKKRQMEALDIKAVRNVHLLPVSMDSFDLLFVAVRDTIRNDFNIRIKLYNN
jgi:hypothetical protein